VINHFHTQNTKRVVFEEVKIEDIDITDARQDYIFNYGGVIHQGRLYSRNVKEVGFFTRTELVLLKQINQVWKIK